MSEETIKNLIKHSRDIDASYLLEARRGRKSPVHNLPHLLDKAERVPGGLPFLLEGCRRAAWIILSHV